jgi:signal transduction histidine kinase
LSRLKSKHRIQEAEIQLRRKNGAVFFASVNLIRFLLGGEDTILAVVNDISNHKKALEKLRTSEANLHQLSSQLITIQEEERQRIARELHDSVGQLMHALKYSIETSHKQLDADCSRTEMQSRLAQLMPVVQEATAEIRRIVMDLRPSMLDDLGILATINWFCREYSGIYKNIAIDKEIQIEESDIPFELRVVFFRIIQEAFNNVAKHSHASRIRLTIARRANDLVVEITDNGIGLNGPDIQHDPQKSKGFGLSSMRERARASGGAFSIEGSSGDGTRIRVVWPAKGPARETTKMQSGSDRQV